MFYKFILLMMKKKRILIIVIIFVILLTALFCLWFFKWRNVSNNANSSTVKEPYLEIIVAEYPYLVNTICERVEFELVAKNTGDADLLYSDIENEKFVFSFLKEDTKSIIATTDKGTSGVHDLYIKDFGEIKVGETKRLNLYLQESYIGDLDFGYQNALNMLQSNGNGTFSFIFEFERNNGNNSFTILSNVPKIDMDIEAFENSEGYWSNKVCN